MRGMDGYMRGVNLGGWLSQFDAPTKEHFDTFITEEDIRRIAGMGLDHVRVPVDYTVIETEDGVPKEEGYQYIDKCVQWCRANGLHMIIDVSHLSDAGIWDVYHNTTRPFIASHSSARSVCHHARNLSDEMIRAIAERGGVAGINYCAGFLTDTPDADGHYYGTAALIADHIDHMRNVGGIDVVALGSDYDGISRRLEMPDCSYMPLLEAELRRRKYSEEDIEKVFHKNALRVLREFL